MVDVAEENGPVGVHPKDDTVELHAERDAARLAVGERRLHDQETAELLEGDPEFGSQEGKLHEPSVACRGRRDVG